jgi:TonB family protein
MKSIYTLTTALLLSGALYGNVYPSFLENQLTNLELNETPAVAENEYTPPVFPGCEKAADTEKMEACFNNAIIQYVSERVEYPEFLRAAGIEGTPLIRFSVLKDGSVSNVQVVRSVNKLLDSEAYAAIAKLPKMTPATLNGEKIEVQFTLPVRFVLD